MRRKKEGKGEGEVGREGEDVVYVVNMCGNYIRSIHAGGREGVRRERGRERERGEREGERRCCVYVVNVEISVETKFSVCM